MIRDRLSAFELRGMFFFGEMEKNDGVLTRCICVEIPLVSV